MVNKEYRNYVSISVKYLTCFEIANEDIKIKTFQHLFHQKLGTKLN